MQSMRRLLAAAEPPRSRVMFSIIPYQVNGQHGAADDAQGAIDQLETAREQLADAVRGVSKAALLETFRKSVLERDQSLQVVTGGDGLEASRALGRLTELPPVPAS